MAMGRVIVLAALLRSVAAVLAPPDSPCRVKCGNQPGSTATDELVCEQSDYSSSVGVVWRACLTCESTSSYSVKIGKTTYSDLQAMLYNMRYATANCLFGEGLGSNPCITTTACEPLKNAIEYDGLESNVTASGYCNMSILDGYCKMQPSPGETLSIQGDIFSTTEVANVTVPTPTASVTPSGPQGPLSLGAIVGIAIGGLALLLGVTGFCIVMNGKRRRKAYLRRREDQRKQWPSPGGAGEMFETPVSQRPLRGWDASPVSAATDRTYPRYFSPYSSQYNSPVSAVEGPSHQQWPTEGTQNIGVALSPDAEHMHGYWGDRKGKDRLQDASDGYEMQEGVHSGGGNQYVPPPPSSQAPVLNHPGYGRHGPSPHRSLDEEDLRSGRAL
ncbi:hypothetical protein JX265_011814 [Neoarthrinium moseri]|uniref:Uncharacterized protein n=1 Tax=Neoarthrinium moseri TaxID=1658444 RepID=A0A9P9WBB7_9PEZI|nr:hypothetical protein JX265_011814 [Neoarthrinium moseri]